MALDTLARQGAPVFEHDVSDVPRDEHGRWTSGGGGGGAATRAARLLPTGLSPEELRAQVEQNQRRAMRDLPIDEQGNLDYAIGQYGHTGYKGINGALRHGTVDQANSEVLFNLTNMDTAFDEVGSTVPEGGTVVYRGVGPHHLGGLQVGDDFSEQGFLSGSTNRAVANDFATPGPLAPRGGLFEIHLPEGTRVLSGNTAEHELIVDRGTAWHVTAMHQPEAAIAGEMWPGPVPKFFAVLEPKA